jgi:hypothetical protein
VRTAYHDWFRDLIAPLRPNDATGYAEVRVDAATMRLAAEQLRDLWEREQVIVRRIDKDRLWSRVEAGCVTLGAAGTVGLACLAALPPIGVGVGVLGFAGWAINRWRTPKPSRSLGGASMFVSAHRHLPLQDWPS